jgi:hypothetical protein
MVREHGFGLLDLAVKAIALQPCSWQHDAIKDEQFSPSLTKEQSLWLLCAFTQISRRSHAEWIDRGQQFFELPRLRGYVFS